jgi:hypothetical protein
MRIGRAARLIAAAALAGAGCAGGIGASEDAEQGAPGAGGERAAGAGPTAPGATGGGAGSSPSSPTSSAGPPVAGAAPVPLGCEVRIAPVSTITLDDVPAGPGFKLRVRAELVRAPAAPVSSYDWTVMRESTSAGVEPTAVEENGAVIELPLAEPGKYILLVEVRIGELVCTDGKVVNARVAGTKIGYFRVRVAPPLAMSLPAQDIAVEAKTGVPLARQLLLQAGEPVSIGFQDESGQRAISAYVRVSQAPNRIVLEGHTLRGSVSALLLGRLTYDLLVVPDDAVAPALFPSRTPAALNNILPRLDRGTSIAGMVTDEQRMPARDTVVMLRAGALTSTVGTSDRPGGSTCACATACSGWP